MGNKWLSANGNMAFKQMNRRQKSTCLTTGCEPGPSISSDLFSPLRTTNDPNHNCSALVPFDLFRMTLVSVSCDSPPTDGHFLLVCSKQLTVNKTHERENQLIHYGHKRECPLGWIRVETICIRLFTFVGRHVQDMVEKKCQGSKTLFHPQLFSFLKKNKTLTASVFSYMRIWLDFDEQDFTIFLFLLWRKTEDPYQKHMI